MKNKFSYLNLSDLVTLSSFEEIKEFIQDFFSHTEKYEPIFEYKKKICIFYGQQAEIFLQDAADFNNRRIAIRFPMLWLDGRKKYLR